LNRTSRRDADPGSPWEEGKGPYQGSSVEKLMGTRGEESWAAQEGEREEKFREGKRR